MSTFSIRSIADADCGWVRDFITQRWDAEIVVVHGAVYHPHELSGFIAHYNDEKIGLVTYCIENKACEIVWLDSMHENVGVETALIEAVKFAAHQSQCKRLWLITVNLAQYLKPWVSCTLDNLGKEDLSAVKKRNRLERYALQGLQSECSILIYQADLARSCGCDRCDF